MRISNFFYQKWRYLALRYTLWAGLAFVGLRLILQFRIVSMPSLETFSTLLYKPKFHSLDKKGNAYTVQGQSAFSQGSGGEYFLARPWARLQTRKEQEPHCFYIKGSRGKYDSRKQLLELFGDVSFVAQGYTHLFTHYALMNGIDQRIQGNQVVTGEGPLGKFDAHGFTITKQRLQLKGPVRLRMKIQ